MVIPLIDKPSWRVTSSEKGPELYVIFGTSLQHLNPLRLVDGLNLNTLRVNSGKVVLPIWQDISSTGKRGKLPHTEPSVPLQIKRRLFVRGPARENLRGQFVSDRVDEQARLAVPLEAHP